MSTEYDGRAALRPEPSYLPHRQILVVLGGLMAGLFLAALDQTILGVALPAITSDLGGLDKLSWVVTAYLLTSTSSTPLWGKISDLYGRKPVFQTAIVVFISGSVLSALSWGIAELIAFRALQGLGGGGVMALCLATLGDIAPPRERGRYQGYFGAVWAVASVAGPALGGWLTEGPGWRWIFWINVPVGLAALVVTSRALTTPHVRREHRIDYAGAALIVAAASALLLYTSWTGPVHGWLSPLGAGLVVVTVLLSGLLIVVERRTAEPVIPLPLFRDSVFSLSIAFVFGIGVAMFGIMVFTPTYLQIVVGLSPTESGLGMLPMVAGILSLSIGSGLFVSRTGHYKAFPPAGALIVLAGILFLVSLEAGGPYWKVGLAMLVIGVGLGCNMQTLVTVVQNTVPRTHMGAATSSVAFFRAMGGTLGTALFGAVLASRLTHHVLAQTPGADPAAVPNVDDIEAIKRLPEELHDAVVQAFALALHESYLIAVPFVIAAFVVGLFIKQRPLATRESASGR